MIEIQETEDGSRTLYVPEMDEHYHSVKGALTEAEHIFINMGLKQSPAETPYVFEVGFGTGLNAFLTLLEAERQQRHVYFTSIEKYPVAADTIKAMNYPELISPTHAKAYYDMHEAAWNQAVDITPWFTLTKVHADLTTYTFEEQIDVVYFDAFAPEKQSEMWSEQIFAKIYDAMSHRGILTTYCAKGVIRRMLQAAGLKMERLAGPPGGKREILRGTKE